MKCEACHQEIALARVCPYCGHRVKRRSGGTAHTDSADKQRGEERGRFRGRVDERGRPDAQEASVVIVPSLANLLRFLMHPRISGWSKAVVYAALFYILSPIDLVPGALAPILGWMDDVAVLVAAWRFVAGRLRETL